MSGDEPLPKPAHATNATVGAEGNFVRTVNIQTRICTYTSAPSSGYNPLVRLIREYHVFVISCAALTSITILIWACSMQGDDFGGGDVFEHGNLQFPRL